MTINYNSLAEKATKLGIWMEASGGNRYTYLSSLDTPHEGLLVDIGSRKYTVIDEEDVALLPWREYQFRDKHASSYDTYLHRDIMERYLTPDDLVLVSNLHVIHLGDPLDNRRSNLRWVDGRFILDRKIGLPSDIRKRGHRYRVRITFDGETRSRTFMTKADAMVWWYNTRLEMMSNEPWSITLRRLNGMSDE